MPTIARLHYPGALVHLVMRFVNHDFLLVGHEERAAYLERIPRALTRTDWTVLAYALMSSHVHLALVAGEVVPWLFYQRLHTAFARWLNPRLGRLGPVVMGRPSTIYLPIERTAHLVTYIHNNPVRAALVTAPDETTWTSHRMWLGHDTAPPWLAVDRGLALAGFDTTREARQAFHEAVCERSGDPRDPELSGRNVTHARVAARRETALPVEVASPVLAPLVEGEGELALIYRGLPSVEPRWPGDLDVVMACVADQARLPIDLLRSRVRTARVTRARRIAVVAAVALLRRRSSEVAESLGISIAAVSKHMLHAGEVMEAAQLVAATVRARNSTLAA